ncbi:MAG: hypothetical protein LUC93_03155 [Planctomycetaceae bacterium]|nr:hypothetical protein [Planctomycetaceae bacterium]
MSEGLSTCPVCGKPLRLQVCDKSGNIRKPEYEDNPGYSGLGFQLIHEAKDSMECPIATHNGKSLGTFIFDSRDDAIEAWNRRTPEPGTSVVRWVRYDGTEKSKPPSSTRVLVYEPNNWIHIERFKSTNHPQLGAFWSVLPEPPERVTDAER